MTGKNLIVKLISLALCLSSLQAIAADGTQHKFGTTIPVIFNIPAEGPAHYMLMLSDKADSEKMAEIRESLIAAHEQATPICQASPACVRPFNTGFVGVLGDGREIFSGLFTVSKNTGFNLTGDTSDRHDIEFNDRALNELMLDLVRSENAIVK